MWVIWMCGMIGSYLVASSILSFAKNYRLAKSMGFPMVLSPVGRTNILWLIFHPMLVPLLRSLPFSIGSFTHYNNLNWEYEDKHRLHVRYGKIFTHVSPGTLEVICADPAVNHQFLSNKWNYDKNKWLLDASKIYGDHLVTVTGHDWQRHRRITSPPFNARTSAVVWREARRQAGQVTKHWGAKASSGFTTAAQDWQTASMNVLATAALGQSWDFDDDSTKAIPFDEQPHNADRSQIKLYRISVGVLASRAKMLVVLPEWVYSIPSRYLPGTLKELASAYNGFKQSVEHLLLEKKASIACGETIDDSSLLGALILASENCWKEHRSQKNTEKRTKEHDTYKGLSNDELYGNFFLYTLAGHETTATTLVFATYLLAANPSSQEWVAEEVNAIYNEQSANLDGVSYERQFPKLKRCLAVLLETLRLYPPVPATFKSSLSHYRNTIHFQGRSVLIPPETLVVSNTMAAQTLPEFWGDDHLEWRPSRWIEHKHGHEESAQPKPDLESREHAFTESIRDPPVARLSYFPWSAGFRVCPGKHFSQVQFVAMLSTLLLEHRISIISEKNETEDQARKRCLGMLDDCERNPALRAKNPGSVRLRLTAR